MDSKLKGFFDTAQQKAEEVTTAQQAAAAKAAQAEAAKDALSKALRADIDAELSPILDVLRGLPQKERLGFDVRVSDYTDRDKAEFGVYVEYKYHRSESQYGWDDDEGGGYCRPKNEIALQISRPDGGSLQVDVTQYAIVEPGKSGRDASYKRVRGTDFETARQQLAIALGTFAADRMAEIGAALGATSAQAAASDPGPASAPPAADANIDVFKKPLRLKLNNAAADERETVAPVPAQEPAATPKNTAPAKKPFWKLW